MQEIHRLTAGDTTMMQINDRIYRLRYSSLNIIIPPIACTYFGVLALILNDLNKHTLSSIYLLLTYSISVIFSFWGYLQYIYLFLYIKLICNTKKKITIYNKNYPANTKWIILLAKLYGCYRNVFFVLGASYVFGVIYFVLCGSYTLIDNLSNYNDMLPLYMFWGSVFVAIVIFFPVSTIIELNNIKKIVNNLKEQTTDNLNNMISQYSKNKNIYIQKSYLIIAITDTPDYPIKDKLGIIFSIIISCINIAASTVAILDFIVI